MGDADLFLEAGKSGELMAHFQNVMEAEVPSGPKFSAKTCKELGRAITCRTYSTALLELCHLVVAVSDLNPPKGRYENFFWADHPAQAGAYRARLSKAIAKRAGWKDPVLKASSTGIEISYQDGSFSIAYSRMGFLCALMEFMLSALGYIDVDEVLSALLRQNPNRQNVSNAANQLSRSLYDYLKDHLPSVQNLRKCRAIFVFLEQHDTYKGDISALDDDGILAFWQQTAPANDEFSVDFKTFNGVYRSFVRLIQAVDAARDLRALENIHSIGFDQAAGEINPDILSNALEVIDETAKPLDVLAGPPCDRIKFLNSLESQGLENLLESGVAALRLPLSLLRADVFSKIQARLIQAARRKARSNEICNLLNDPCEKDYQGQLSYLQKLSAHVDKVLHASIYALIKAHNHHAITLIFKLYPDLDLRMLAERLIPEAEAENSNVVVLGSTCVSDHFIQLLEDPQELGPELAALIAQCHKAYQTLNRQGFSDDVTNNAALSEAFAQGATALIEVANDLNAYLERLLSLEESAENFVARFRQDRTLFNETFMRLYGGQS